jgi:hypothetical protein
LVRNVGLIVLWLIVDERIVLANDRWIEDIRYTWECRNGYSALAKLMTTGSP